MLSVKLLSEYTPKIHVRSTAALVSCIMCLVLGVEASKNSRLQFVSQEGDLTSGKSEIFHLMATPGGWMSTIDLASEFINNNIKPGERFVSIPGEDPLHLITGRRHPLRFFQFNDVTLLHELDDVRRRINEKGVEWILIKRRVQAADAFIDTTPLVRDLKQNYTYHSVTGDYEIYKRKAVIKLSHSTHQKTPEFHR